MPYDKRKKHKNTKKRFKYQIKNKTPRYQFFKKHQITRPSNTKYQNKYQTCKPHNPKMPNVDYQNTKIPLHIEVRTPKYKNE